LFPSSPAKYGPWKTLPDGATVGSGFGRELAASLSQQQRPVVAAMAGLRGALALSGSSAWSQTDGSFSGGAMSGMGSGATRAPVVITISGNTFGSRTDIDYLIDEMDRRLRLQGAFKM
jgi:hypothetical protein